MKRRLFICNNPYQIIVSIILAVQLENNQIINDILLTDNFRGAKKVYKNLSDSDFFDAVFTAEINKLLFPKNLSGKIKKAYYLFNGKRLLEENIGNNFLSYVYDEIFYNNDDMFLYKVVEFFYKKNESLKVFRFEEGYSSYIRPFCSLRAQKFFDKKNHGCTFKDILAGMYYFKKEQVQFVPPAKLYKIETCLNDIVRENVRVAFPVENLHIDLNNKLIIFEESFFKDHGYTSDEKMYEKIIDKVGRENVVIKLHPRSTVNRYEKMNVQTLECDDAPWEAILLLNNLCNVKFMSLASGSVINSRLMLGDETTSFLMYKCVDTPVPTLDESFEKFVEEFAKDNNKGLYIPNRLEETFDYL